MANINRILTLAKMALILLMAIFGYCWIYYYGIFTSEGSDIKDLIRTVKVNDHGSLVYITANQSNLLTYLLCFSVASFIISIIIDVYQRKHS